MDFQDRGETDPELSQGQESEIQPGTGTNMLPAGQDVVTLPPGASLDDIVVEGRDLVIQLADGSRIVIPDGAVFVPQIVIDGVTVPPFNIAQLLTGNEPQPAAGTLQSSGGNFAEDEGAIQDAFALGDLLPFTDFGFPQNPDDEIIPDLVGRDPDVVIRTPNNPAGAQNATASVDEDGLPARGNEPEGTNAPRPSETTTGTIVFSAPDGLASVTIEGIAVTGVGQTIATQFGTLTITSLDLAAGTIGYSYSLGDNTLGAGNAEVLTVVVTETDGDQATATLTIAITDDAPIAADDLGQVPAGSHALITGDVLVNDVPGADGYAIEGAVLEFGNGESTVAPGTALQGQYGVLTLNADGTYSYARDGNTPGGVEESFTYTIVDQDGSTSTATLVVEIGDADDVFTGVPREGDGTVVNEGGLPARGDEPAGTGEISDADGTNDSDPSERTSSTVTFNSPDGVASLTINGVAINGAELPLSIVVDGGTLVITNYTYDPLTGDGSFDYLFTLNDNTQGDTTFSFELALTDLDGDRAEDTLVITVFDDMPSALDDNGAVAAGEYGPIGGNVVANDTPGADGATVTSYSGTGGSGTTGATVQGTYGTLTIAADGTYSYTRDPGTPGGVSDTFNYVITDGDGDEANANLIIAIADSPTALDLPDEGEGGTGVNEAGLNGPPAGSDAASNSEQTTGTFTYTAPDGPAVVTIDGVAVAAVGQLFSGDFGTLRIDNIADGSITYTYTLTINTSGDTTSDNFVVRVTDQDGDFSEGTLGISIVDDIPVATDDADSVTEGLGNVADGNVFTGIGGTDANATDGVADVIGADGAALGGAVTGARLGTEAGGGALSAVGGPTVVSGLYGDLTINPDGSYSYVLTTASIPVGVTSETFTYQVTDGDGDNDLAQLVITLNQDARVPDTTGSAATVYEDGLADGVQHGVNSETATGTFTVDGNNESYTLTLDGDAAGPVTITAVGDVVTTSKGVLTITSISAPDAGGVVTYGYSYTLSAALTHTGQGEVNPLSDTITMAVTDATGDVDASPASIVISIVDDIPVATDDADSVTEGLGNVADGNVFTGIGGTDANATDGVADVIGADGAALGGAVTGARLGTEAGGGALSAVGGPTVVSGLYGDLTINPDGSYSYVLTTASIPVGVTSETFTYQVTDGDGDNDLAQLVITLNQDARVPDTTGSAATVYEDGLADGVQHGVNSETATGTFTVDGNNESYTLTLDGDAAGPVTITAVGDVVTTSKGVLTITSISAPDAGGVVTYGYSYTLSAALTHTGQGEVNPLSDTITMAVTDATGDVDASPASIVISIVDDIPVATDDADSVTEGLGNVADGNVFTGIGGTDANATDGVADVIGADGAALGGAVTGARLGTEAGGGALSAVGGPTVVSGLYGDLTINPDGSYSYVLTTASIPVGVTSETFTYQVTDGDGDNDLAQLVITLNQDARVPDTTGSAATVYEDGLADGVQHGVNSETATGTFTVDGNNESYTLTLDGDAAGPVTITAVGDVVTTSKGVLTITSISAPDAGGVVTYGYSYTLSAALTHTGQGEVNPLSDTITMAVTDATGDVDASPASIVISIVDDIPVATDDADSVTEGLGNVADGNVFTGIGGTDANATDGVADVIGADGAALGGAVTGARLGTEAGGGALSAVGGPTVVSGLYGDLTINPDGSYSYVLTTASIPVGVTSETFTYQVTDGDGDNDLAQLVITLNQDARVPDTTGSAATVYEDGLADGVQHGVNSETATGTFTVDGNNESYTLTLDGDAAGPVTITAVGDVVTTSKGVLTITSISAPDAGGVVTYGYSYTLSAALTHTGQGEVNPLSDTITMAVTDATGDVDASPASIVISIVDDIPVATDDADSVTEGLGNVADGNVFTGIGGTDANATDGVADVIGADGAALGGAVTGARLGTEAGGGALSAVGGPTVVSGLYGDLTINPDGSYSYVLTTASIPVGVTSETFTYQVTDGDGDNDLAQLVITLNQDARVPDTTGSAATVYEDGLADGVQHGVNSETATGTFTVDGNNESYTLTLDGDAAGPVTITAVGDVVTTSKGVLTITSISAPDAGGVVTYGYSYTLSAALTHTGQGEVNPLSDTITMAVTDATGDVDASPASIVISIVDDIPVATDDADSVTEGLGNVADGNVFTGIGGTDANATDGVADVIGADGAALGGAVTGARLGTEAGGGALSAVGGPTVVSGLYGDLTINPDGSYSYVLTTASIPVGVTSETFTYQVTDGDGDNDLAQLVITLNQDARVPDTTGSAATVYEDGLADGVQHGVNSETATGTFTVDGNNESYTLTLDGDAAGPVTITAVGDVVTTSKGVLTITSISAPDAGGVVTYGYSYTLSAALTHTGQGEVNPLSDTITMAVTDATGDVDASPASIVISIVDDIPVATDDADSVTEGLGNVADGNVFTGIGGTDANATDGVADVIGADGAALGGAVTGARLGTEAGGGALSAVGGPTVVSGLYGDLTINPDGSYSYVLTTASIPVGVTSETFTYQVTDGDGDNDLAQLVITLNQDARVPDTTGSAATVYEDGLADGVQHGVNSETATGTFTVDGNNESYTLTLDGDAAGPVTITAVGDVVTTSKGVLTITSISAPDAGGVVTYGYSYTLSAALTHTGQGEVNPLSDTITMAVTDATGDVDASPASIVISIVDDIPVATDDADSVTEGLGNVADGNVFTGIGGTDANATDGVADVIGADGAALGGAVTGARLGTEAGGGALSAVGGPTVVSGLYGDLTINPDGSYSYVLTTASIPVGVTSETFTYQVTDGDGDNDLAQLVITLNQDARVPDTTGSAATVYEDGLADGVQHGVNSETATGTFTVDGNNESYTLTLDGDAAGPVTITAVGDVVTTSKGVLTITSISAPDAGGVVTYGYSYTLSAALTHTGQGEVNPLSDTITMAVTDATGDVDASPASIVISIVDDIPVATDDADSVTEGLGNVADGNVFTGIGGTDANATDGVADVIGADGAALGGAVTGARLGTEAGGGALSAVGGPTVVSGLYGDLTINPDGSYSYVLTTASIPVGVTSETFTYQVTDGDGDNDLAQLVITLNQDARVPDTTGSAATVYEDGLADGVQHGVNSETATGTFTVDGNNESYTLTLDGDAAGPVTITAVGDVVTTSKGVLTITSISAPDAGGVVTYGYSYTLSAALTHTGQGEVNPLSDTITMAVTDATGDVDASPASIVISIVDDIPVATDDADSVTEGLGNVADGNVFTGIGGTDANATDGVADVIGADGAALGGAVTGARLGTEAGGGALSAVGGPTVVSGLYGDLTINPDGSYSYVLTTASIPVGVTSETFTYQVTDGDGDNDLAQLVITLNQDARVPDTTGSAATVYEDGLADGVQHGVNSETATGTFTVDGNNESYTLTLDGDAAGPVTITAVGDVVTTSKGVLTITSISAPDAGGVVTYGYSYTLSAALTHTGQGEVNPLSDTITMAVTDATGDVDASPASIVISIVDDIPVATIPAQASVNNTAGSMSPLTSLDTVDGDVDDNYGADGPGAMIFTAATIAASTELQNLTSSFVNLDYTISGGGTVLTATKQSDNTEVFKIELQPGGGADKYKITISQPLDSKVNINFNDGTYEFVGGNDPWAGFVPNGQKSNGGTPLDDDSSDLLITPFGDGGTGDSINGNANAVGTGGGGAGQNVAPGEGLRLDYVIDLTGLPAKGGGGGADYDGQVSQQDHSFDKHDTVNGALVQFGQGSGNSTVRLSAIDVVDGAPNGPAPDLVYNVGTLDSVTQISIIFDGEIETVVYDPGTTYPVSVTVGSPGGATDRVYTVNFVDSGGGRYATVTGIMDTQVTIATFTADGFQALEVYAVSGSDFELTGFGSSTITNDPINFTVPISIKDGDGDIADSGVLAIQVNPVMPAALPLATSSQSTQSFSTSTMLLNDPLTDPNATNDNGSGSGMGGLSSIQFQSALRIGTRMSEISAVAAISGAILLSEQIVSGPAPASFATDAPFGMMSVLPTGIGTKFAQEQSGLDSFDPSSLLTLSVAGPGASDLANLLGVDSGLSDGRWSIESLQAEPDQFEPLSVIEPQGEPGLAMALSTSFGVEASMEALLMLDPAQDLATLDGLRSDDAVGAVLSEIAAGAQLDQVLEMFEDQSPVSDYLVTQNGGPDVGILDHHFEAGIAVIDAAQLDTDQAEAAIAATAQA